MRVINRHGTTRVGNGCMKFSYSSKSKARKAMRHQFAGLPRRLTPYKCRFCDQWHLTSRT